MIFNETDCDSLMQTTVDVDSIVTLFISLVALIISIVALRYTIRAFVLKEGTSIRGSFTTTTSQSCDDKYISNLTLENMKDKASVIFAVYVRMGHNYYITIEEFEDEHLILKPFEAYTKEFDPIEFYAVSMHQVGLKKLFDNDRVKKRIVLSTSEGRYVVRSMLHRWSPIHDFFRNHMTHTIVPIRAPFNGKSYGSNAKFIVEIRLNASKDEVIAIYPRDHEVRKFKAFRLTKESLQSREELELFLHEQASSNKIVCDDIVVHDIEEWRETAHENYDRDVVELDFVNWATYRGLGPLFTMASNFKMKRSNKKLQKEQKRGNK